MLKLEVYGDKTLEVASVDDAMAKVRARYPGAVRSDHWGAHGPTRRFPTRLLIGESLAALRVEPNDQIGPDDMAIGEIRFEATGDEQPPAIAPDPEARGQKVAEEEMQDRLMEADWKRLRGEDSR